MFTSVTAMGATNGQKNCQKVDFGTLALYGLCLAVSGVVVHHISDYEFSCVLTLSALFQALAFAHVLLQIEVAKNVNWVSGKSMALFATAIVFRLTSTISLEGYLPLDRTGDFHYQVVDILSLMTVLKILHSCYCSYRASLAAHEDTANVKDIVTMCVALAIVIHPELNEWVTFDIAWAASLYVDAVAMVPQVMMISKTQQTPGHMGDYLFCTLLSWVFSAWFWMHGATNLLDMDQPTSTPAACAVVSAHVVQFALLANMGYNYVIKSGRAKSEN